MPYKASTSKQFVYASTMLVYAPTHPGLPIVRGIQVRGQMALVNAPDRI